MHSTNFFENKVLSLLNDERIDFSINEKGKTKPSKQKKNKLRPVFIKDLFYYYPPSNYK